jgi:hypothetical protein
MVAIANSADPPDQLRRVVGQRPDRVRLHAPDGVGLREPGQGPGGVCDPSGDPSLDLWSLFNLTLDTAGNATVTPVQTFIAGNENTVFSVPSGPKPPRR